MHFPRGRCIEPRIVMFGYGGNMTVAKVIHLKEDEHGILTALIKRAQSAPQSLIPRQDMLSHVAYAAALLALSSFAAPDIV